MNWWEWVFSGVGVLALGLLIEWSRKRSRSSGQKAEITAQGARVSNSPVASGSEITQTIGDTHHHYYPPAVVSQPHAIVSEPAPEPEAQSEKREMVDVTPEHLTGFYHEGHTSVQASKLAEAFIGKWMKVTGPLGDVLGNYDNQRLVIFSDRSIYTHDFVNMFFRDKKWFGRLSTIKRG